MNTPSSHESGIAPANRPTIVLAGNAGPMGSMRTALGAAALGTLRAIDLDVRPSWVVPPWSTVAPITKRDTIRIRSVWLPETVRGPAAGPRADRLKEFLQRGQDELGLRALIVPRLTVDTDTGVNVSRLARDLAKHTNGVVRLAIGVQAESLIRAADHLDRLTAIRRAVEEWDLDLALDLTGNVSSRWESEAAVAKLLPRLAVVRLESWLTRDGTLDTSPRAQLAARTVAMLSDQGYSGIISLLPGTSSWLNRPSLTAMAASFELLYQDIQTRYARARTHPAFDVPPPVRHPSPDRP